MILDSGLLFWATLYIFPTDNVDLISVTYYALYMYSGPDHPC